MIGEAKSPIASPFARITKDRLVVGLDIANDFSQVSYSYVTDEEPKTLSVSAESEEMCIPTVLGKYYSQNVWIYGDKAKEMAENNEGYLVANLLENARLGKPVEVEGRDYDPVDLLALFMKKCLSLLSTVAPIEKVSAIVITIENPDSTNIAILTKAINTIRIKTEKVFFQSYSESVYNYMINQKKELWNHDVIVCHLKDDALVLRSMKTNHQTTPHVITMEEIVVDSLNGKKLASCSDEYYSEADDKLLEAIKPLCKDTYVSSVYLIGAGFEKQWYEKTLKFICQNRRVFLGNNLFSKGATYAAKEKMFSSDAALSNVYIGKDKVKSNVGIVACKDNEDAYVPLLEAGKNWFETSKECEFIIGEADKIDFIVTPLNGNEAKSYSVYLDGLPQRPDKATRVKIELKMKSEKLVSIIITDLGFGEFFPPTGQRFKSEIVLD